MSKKKMKHVLLIFILTILSGCVKLPPDAYPISGLSSFEATRKQLAAENGYNYISNDTNIRLISALPAKLGDWPEYPGRYVINFERRHAHGLGYSKRYNEGLRRHIWADVFFFHARKTGLADGIKSKQFLDLWAQTISEFNSAYSFVRTCNLKDKTDTTQKVNGITFRKCQLATVIGSQELKSLMFMTVFEGTFLKVRISYRPDYKNAETEIDKFMAHLAFILDFSKRLAALPSELVEKMEALPISNIPPLLLILPAPSQPPKAPATLAAP
jgi:hypothetical protein